MCNQSAVHLFMPPRRNPCGEKSTRCGPVGQTAAEIAAGHGELSIAHGTPAPHVGLGSHRPEPGPPSRADTLVRPEGQCGEGECHDR